MRVVCSWCEAEGKRAIVREKEPFEDPEETHGVCPEHKDRLSESDPKDLSRPSARAGPLKSPYQLSSAMSCFGNGRKDSR